MEDLFSKRMKNVMKYGSIGAKITEDSNILADMLFDTDQNFRTGMLYDWEMNELEKVDFKFEKVKTYSAEKLSVEYMIQFRPNYNPEYKFRDQYYRKDGRERLGFYIDVYDNSRKLYEKWLIVGKDDRVAFDRYNALKCDWCFEWITDGKYYNTIGCVRSAQDGSVNNLTRDELGGTSVNDELSIYLPSNKNASTIKLGTRFIISDNVTNPWVYEVIRIKDTTPLGTTKVYLKQALFNSHTDFCGIIDESVNHEFCFETIPDLPTDFGGQYHMICDCIRSKGLPQLEVPVDVEWKLYSNTRYIYVNGQTAVVKAIPSEDNFVGNCEWHIKIDGLKYSIAELTPYFDISISKDTRELSIRAINKVMETYIVRIEIYDMAESYYDSVEMEVRV